MSAKTTIYFIRHGECAGNRERRIRGCVDFPLNKNGIKQARALAERMKELGIGRIVTSPLGLSPVVKDGFRNICFGSWENRLQSEIIEEFPEMWKTWLTAPESLRVDGAENIEEVRRRSLRELERTVAEYAGETIALVSHSRCLPGLWE